MACPIANSFAIAFLEVGQKRCVFMITKELIDKVCCNWMIYFLITTFFLITTVSNSETLKLQHKSVGWTLFNVVIIVSCYLTVCYYCIILFLLFLLSQFLSSLLFGILIVSIVIIIVSCCYLYFLCYYCYLYFLCYYCYLILLLLLVIVGFDFTIL